MGLDASVVNILLNGTGVVALIGALTTQIKTRGELKARNVEIKQESARLQHTAAIEGRAAATSEIREAFRMIQEVANADRDRHSREMSEMRQEVSECHKERAKLMKEMSDLRHNMNDKLHQMSMKNQLLEQRVTKNHETDRGPH